MVPNSEINEVHTAHLGDKYPGVAAYLQDPEPNRRRSYEEYVDRFSESPVYELDDDKKSVTFQSECLIPRDDRGRTRVLLLFSNAHPESIRNGMFHTAEGRVAALWSDLCDIGLFSGDRTTLENASRLRNHCLNITYDGPFALGFACYWLFPTFHPDHLWKLFTPEMEPPGLENPNVRLNRLLAEWQPEAIINFNGKVFEALTGESTDGYTKRPPKNLPQGIYRTSNHEYPLFQAYPTGWRYRQDATRLRRASLERIAKAIQGVRGRQ